MKFLCLCAYYAKTANLQEVVLRYTVFGGAYKI